MRIVYAACGSRGDTQGAIAFAVEVRRLPIGVLAFGCARAASTLAPSTRRWPSQLVRAGHELRLYIAPEYLSLVPTVAGLSVIGSQQTVAASMDKIAPHIATGKTGAMLKALVETQIEFFAREANALKAACDGWAEILIVNAVADAMGFAVTEALHIKALIANVQPQLPTRELFPMSGSLKLPKFMHMFIWWLFWEKITLPKSLRHEIDKWKAANGTHRPSS